MTNTRLTDLLQEEAQKFIPSPDEATIEVNYEKVTETDIPVTDKTPAITNTVTDLQITIQELQINLEKSQNQEYSLQQEISQLQTALLTEKALTERLTKELYETKKTALQLAESNSKLIEEMNALKNKPVKESTQPTQEVSKSLSISPKKSYNLPGRMPQPTKPVNDDFKDKTWLYD